jgi:threonine/homoserine/homoserine lactone efflux protein
MEWAHLIIETAGLAVLIYQSWQNSKAIKKVEHATNSLMDARIVTERSEATLQERAANVAAVATNVIPPEVK